jgi:hypothetical protein
MEVREKNVKRYSYVLELLTAVKVMFQLITYLRIRHVKRYTSLPAESSSDNVSQLP